MDRVLKTQASDARLSIQNFKLLIKHGANPSYNNALIVALRSGLLAIAPNAYIEQLRVLLDAGANPNLMIYDDDHTPIDSPLKSLLSIKNAPDNYVHNALDLLFEYGLSPSENINLLTIDDVLLRHIQLFCDDDKTSYAKQLIFSSVKANPNSDIQEWLKTPQIEAWFRDAKYFIEHSNQKNNLDDLIHYFFERPEAKEEESLKIPFNEFLGIFVNHDGEDLFLKSLTITNQIESNTQQKISFLQSILSCIGFNEDQLLSSIVSKQFDKETENFIAARFSRAMNFSLNKQSPTIMEQMLGEIDNNTPKGSLVDSRC